ncbi:putative major facilitator superfamily protein [Lyophyllum shimeji]|uniref:Major facilitator superfamily protein n=1 Tax=Lyophyllum shimeji TaxID=47721 RepID=A0A9P3PER6_LYOSH|nr:putative major facilitator superfamily protein [Lyophyllum shimeji]
MSPRSHYGSVARGIPSLVPQPVEGLEQQEHDVVSDRRDNSLTKRWKKPSPWILLCLVPFVAMVPSGTIAPRIEVYTLLACHVHKPDMYPQTSLTLGTSINVFETLSTASPPVLRNEYAPFQWELSLSSSPIFLSQNGTRVAEKPGSCASDPVVQAAVAKLTTAISTTAGVLGCLTTAWWGSFSDRHGRIRLLSVAVVGRLVTDLNFILVSRYFQHLPGGYWFMIFGPVVDSLLGDLAAYAAIFAYVADTTTEEAR